MKRIRSAEVAATFCAVALLLSGCLLKKTAVTPTRTFILSPIAEKSSPSTGAQQISVEVGLVKMPSYLERDSMLIRKGGNEVEYLENALWADRLDQLFRQALAENLSSLLPPSQSPGARQTVVRVSVDVKRFDVDTAGHGTLLAHWRLNVVGNDKLAKTDDSHLKAAGPSPRGNPQSIATTLSKLTADFSRDLAREITEMTIGSK